MEAHLHDKGDNSCWSARNPGQPVIPTRAKGAPLTDAEKASCALKAAQRKQSQKALHDAIAEFVTEQSQKIGEIVRLHNVTQDHVKNLVNFHTHYKKTRAPQLMNALVHAKAKEVNADLPTGSKYTLKEVRKLVEDDPALHPHMLTQDEKNSYITDLVEYRTLKTSGSRANNIAATRDVVATMEKIKEELDGLRDHCGTYATFVIAGGHVNDQTPATWYATDNASDFWEDALNLVLDDVARKFEQWACSQGKNIVEHDSLENMQKQAARLVLAGLRRVTNKTNIIMNYPNYMKAIVLSYSVILEGWPTTIPFTSPWNIHTVSDMRALRNALKAGTCAWRTMSRSELEKYKADVERRQIAGEVIGKPCKKRSDAGTSHKRKNAAGGSKENRRPSKKSREQTRASHRQPKSREIIEDSDESPSSDGDEED
ncbi:hypothetical protein EDD22DRAFT_830056 [Suillus occidentalis]|nr:hypothetical protein EDD22DRAFT_830056 [Suillus occidentalis]